MATEVTPETVAFLKASLKKHGFDHALQRASVDCIAAGMDADDFTYQLVALFAAHILSQSMLSHTDVEKKAVTLRGNTTAMVMTIQQVALQLAKQLDQAAETPKDEKVH